MNGKWTAALTAVLFALAVLAVTPVGNSAKSLLVFAKNSDRVDGIHAAKTPKAGALLALNKNAKFPASVIPKVTGPQGPAGERGDTGATGAAGPQGEAGATGASGGVGPAGPKGADGVSGYEVVTVTSPPVPPRGNVTVTAFCPEGKSPVGGGVRNTENPAWFGFSDSYPDGSGWTVRGQLGPVPVPQTFTVYAVCVNA